jgi:hypothetical protein
MDAPRPVDTAASVATDLLLDIAAAYGLGHAAPTRSSFAFLEPFYSASREEVLVDRLAAAFKRLSDGKKELFGQALLVALDRCASVWLGIMRTRAVAELAIRVAGERLTDDHWSRLFRRTDPTSPTVTAEWIVGLVNLLSYWEVHIKDVRMVDWAGLVRQADVAAVPVVAEWALRELSADDRLSAAVLGQARARIIDERAALTRHWPDVDTALRRIDKVYDEGRRARDDEGRRRPTKWDVHPAEVDEGACIAELLADLRRRGMPGLNPEDPRQREAEEALLAADDGDPETPE